MWLLIFLFFFFVLVLGWILFGYYIWLFLLKVLRKEKKPDLQDLKKFPAVSLIVATYNEEDFILQKIENIKSLDYPLNSLQVIFVDGKSQDKTQKIIKEQAGQGMEFLEAPLSGKINQINFALKHCKADFIFVSDADSLMSANSIKEAIREFMTDKNIYVTGIYSYPKDSHIVDRYYWLTQNKGRLLETWAFSSSIVVAVCYSFRKSLLDAFPPDVVADDIYISYLANTLGYRVSYIDSCHAVELRGPKNINDFLSHKYRKSNAFLRESLRFFYIISEMNPTWKVIYLTKISQILFTPWAFSFYIILGFALISLGNWDVFCGGSLFLLILVFIAKRVFSLVKTEEKFPITIKLETFLLSVFILFVTGITFIFFRQNSNYRKLDAY